MSILGCEGFVRIEEGIFFCGDVTCIAFSFMRQHV